MDAKTTARIVFYMFSVLFYNDLLAVEISKSAGLGLMKLVFRGKGKTFVYPFSIILTYYFY